MSDIGKAPDRVLDMDMCRGWGIRTGPDKDPDKGEEEEDLEEPVLARMDLRNELLQNSVGL